MPQKTQGKKLSRNGVFAVLLELGRRYPAQRRVQPFLVGDFFQEFTHSAARLGQIA